MRNLAYRLAVSRWRRTHRIISSWNNAQATGDEPEGLRVDILRALRSLPARGSLGHVVQEGLEDHVIAPVSHRPGRGPLIRGAGGAGIGWGWGAARRTASAFMYST